MDSVPQIGDGLEEIKKNGTPTTISSKERMENMETSKKNESDMTYSPTRKKTGKEFIDFFKDVLEKALSKKKPVKNIVEENLTYHQERVCLKRSAKVVLTNITISGLSRPGPFSAKRRLIDNSRVPQQVKALARQELMENNFKTESELAILNIPE